MPWLVKAETLLRSRAHLLARPPVENLVGLVCLVLAAVLMLPVPLGNTLPALAISVMALGVLQRDGVWIVCGLLAATVAGGVVWGVVWAMIQAVVLLLGPLLGS